jgi:hypothetical protein
LTTDALGSTLGGTWGEVVMKRLRWMLVFLLTGAAISISAVPRTDLPETAFNEVDAPVNQAPPVFPRIKFIRPAGDPIILPSVLPNFAAWGVSRFVREMAPMPSHRHSHSLQNLLCTFLI